MELIFKPYVRYLFTLIASVGAIFYTGDYVNTHFPKFRMCYYIIIIVALFLVYNRGL